MIDSSMEIGLLENRFTPNGENRLLQLEKTEQQPKIHTDKQLAKMAGVGTGTVARFNKVMNLEISENETRKDFSKAERIDYARRLERVESLKAKERILSNQNNEAAVENFPPQVSEGKTRDIVAEKLASVAPSSEFGRG